MTYVLLGVCGFLAAFCLYLAWSKDRAVESLMTAQTLERGGWNAERTNLIHANDEERRSWDAERKELMAANDEERKSWANERRDLNNRIQVPQAAPFMDPGGEQKPQHVPFDDDEMFAEAQKEALEQWP